MMVQQDDELPLHSGAHLLVLQDIWQLLLSQVKGTEMPTALVLFSPPCRVEQMLRSIRS